MTPAELDFLATLTRTQAGLNLTGAAAAFAESRLAPVARRENLASVSDLIARLAADLDPGLAAQAVEALADQNTCFFRDRQLFERIRTHVLPQLAERRNGAPIRIWSAGCSTGQEPYSLAMMASELAPATRPDMRIVASDLSDRALQKARTGLFSHFEVQRGLPIRTLLQNFRKVEEHWQISPELRQSVRWGRVNLIDDLSRFGPFDMILCRNVLSAMDPRAAQKVIAGLDGALAPDGWMMLGDAEDRISMPAAFSGESGLYARNPAYGREAA
jgi:chemotaxis protein methyltransferase CheR